MKREIGATLRPENKPEYGGWVLMNEDGKVVGGPYASEHLASVAKQAVIARETQGAKPKTP